MEGEERQGNGRIWPAGRPLLGHWKGEKKRAATGEEGMRIRVLSLLPLHVSTKWVAMCFQAGWGEEKEKKKGSLSIEEDLEEGCGPPLIHP